MKLVKSLFRLPHLLSTPNTHQLSLVIQVPYVCTHSVINDSRIETDNSRLIMCVTSGQPAHIYCIAKQYTYSLREVAAFRFRILLWNSPSYYSSLLGLQSTYSSASDKKLGCLLGMPTQEFKGG